MAVIIRRLWDTLRRPWVLRHLPAYIRGELPVESRREIARWIDADAGIEAAADDLRRTDAGLRRELGGLGAAAPSQLERGWAQIGAALEGARAAVASPCRQRLAAQRRGRRVGRSVVDPAAGKRKRGGIRAHPDAAAPASDRRRNHADRRGQRYSPHRHAHSYAGDRQPQTPRDPDRPGSKLESTRTRWQLPHPANLSTPTTPIRCAAR
ncbi:MAG: hypothetical protein HND48_25760 [Chloroflexi bacterium]|nr:hypothetical protein [Chloroflexota bacterium]